MSTRWTNSGIEESFFDEPSARNEVRPRTSSRQAGACAAAAGVGKAGHAPVERDIAPAGGGSHARAASPSKEAPLGAPVVPTTAPADRVGDAAKEPNARVRGQSEPDVPVLAAFDVAPDSGHPGPDTAGAVAGEPESGVGLAPAFVLLVGTCLSAWLLGALDALAAWSTMASWMLLWALVAFSAWVVVAYLTRPEPSWGDEILDPQHEAHAGGAAQGGERSRGRALEQAIIRREIRSESLQHPATLVPLALALAATTYLLMDTGRPAGLVAGATATVALLAGGTAFAWRYIVRYSVEYTKHARRLLLAHAEIEERHSETQARMLRARLRQEFERDGPEAAARVLDDLGRAYDGLGMLLAEQRSDDPWSVAHIPSLATETYRQGLSVLADALRVRDVTREWNRERLRRELAEGERAVLAATRLPESTEREALLELRRAQLAAQRERIAELDALLLRIDELLHQASRCESALYRARIEMAGIRTGRSGASVDGVVAALRETVRQARDVQRTLQEAGL